MISRLYNYPIFFLGITLFICCSPLKVVQKPILFDAERRQLSLEYLENRHNLIQEEPIIVPRMVVAHWTAIPTMEKTYQVFYPSRLPGSRSGIQSASQLNVSSQYLVDRDGTIYQLLPDTIFARHTIGLNYCAIGIENVGNGTDLPLTRAQLNANIKLIKRLSAKHPLEFVIGHYEYTLFDGHPIWREPDPNYRTKKTDPGEDFMFKLRKRLKRYHLKGPPKQDSDPGTS